MSFNGDRTLRGKDQIVKYTKEQINEIVICSTDPIYFAEKYYTITTLDHGKQIIKFWDFQKKLLKVLVEVPDGKRNVVVCSSRQISKTTITCIYVTWCVLFKKDYKIAILANKERTACEILDRIKLSFSYLPMWLQQGIIEWNSKNVKLENNSEILACSTSSSAIRGFSMNELVLDEFAHVQKSVQNLLTASVVPIISSGKTSKIIMLSTPNGAYDQFYSTFMDAKRNLNNYYPVKILWDAVPGRDEAWKQNMIKSLPGGALQFLQEFDCKFFGADSTLIESNALESIIPTAAIEFKWSGLVSIYENPIANKKYICAVDVAGGTGKNYSVIQVLKINNLKDLQQVAVFRSNTHSPYDLCKYVMELSEFYNKCQVLIESNADCGAILTSQLFHTYEFERLIFVDGKIGLKSNKQKKAEGNYLLKRYIEHKWLRINDRQTLLELSLYKEQSLGCFGADQSDTDDCVTSLLWAIYALHLPDINQDLFLENGEVNEGSTGSSDNFVAIFD
jgi:hypothetical protein